MRLHVLLLTSLACVLFGGAATASPIITGFASDADFLANANFVKSFGANVRWGDAGPAGDWEYSVVDAFDTPIGAANPKQHAWAPGPSTNDHVVTFQFDGVDSILLDPSLPAGASAASGLSGVGLNALAIRARANSGDAANLSAPITITFTSGAPIVLPSLIGDGDAEYIVVLDPRFASGFTVTADAQLQDGNGSLPQYGFKVGIIPEPSTALLLGAGLVLLARNRQRS